MLPSIATYFAEIHFIETAFDFAFIVSFGKPKIMSCDDRSLIQRLFFIKILRFVPSSDIEHEKAHT